MKPGPELLKHILVYKDLRHVKWGKDLKIGKIFNFVFKFLVICFLVSQGN